MPGIETSVSAVLAERVRQHPDGPAYTFVNYDVDPAEFSRSLTWSRVRRRAQVVAAELATCGSPGDRVAILAPQGFEYIVGALGAVGCSPNDIDFEASRQDLSVNSFLADIDNFDAEFFEISPSKEIRSKGRAGV